MDEISDEQINDLMDSILVCDYEGYFLVDGYEQKFRQWLVPILATEREHTKKECMEIAEDCISQSWVAIEIKRRIMEL